MTLDEMAETFKRLSEEDEFLKFDRVKDPRHQRPDLCAFLILHDLVPGTRDMVAGADHDEIYLAVRPEELAAVASEDALRDLVRCGVRYSASIDSLCMFA